MLALLVWSVIVGIFGILVLADTVYEVVVTHNALVVVYKSIFLWIWAPAAVRAIKRQNLKPRWLWIVAGTVGGILILVPIWHHGREFTSSYDKVISWLAFFAALVFIALQFSKPG